MTVTSSPESPMFGRIAVTTIAFAQLREEFAQTLLGRPEWPTGPLALGLMTPNGASRATLPQRATYLDDHVVSMVLGGNEVRRLHRLLLPPIGSGSGTRVWGAELVELKTLHQIGSTIERALHRRSQPNALIADPPSFAVVLHADVAHRGRSRAEIIADIRSIPSDDVLADIGLGHLRIADRRGRRESFRLVLATPGDSRLARLTDEADADPERQWSFCLASATLPKSLAADPSSAFEIDEAVLDVELDEDSFMPLSADWRVGVIRDGAAFVGTRPDRGTARDGLWTGTLDGRSDGEYFDFAELYVRTIYTDAMLLAILQRQALLRLRATVLAASRREERVSVARAVEAELAAFRERFWWSDVSRGGPGDRLLEAYHHQHSLQRTYDQVDRDAKSLTDRVRLSSDRGRVGALFLIGLTSLLSLVLTMARFVDGDEHVGRTLAWVTVVFAVLLVVLMVAFPDLRQAARDAVRRSRPAQPDIRPRERRR